MEPEHIKNFLMPTNSKILIMLAVLIIGSLSPYFIATYIIFYAIVYYVFACFITWGIDAISGSQGNMFSKRNMRYLKIISVAVGFLSIMFGSAFLDITFLFYMGEGSLNVFTFVAGTLLTVLGVILMIVYVIICKIEKSLIMSIMRLIRFPRFHKNTKNVKTVAGMWLLLLSTSLFVYRYFGMTYFYVIALFAVTITFLWITLKLK